MVLPVANSVGALCVIGSVGRGIGGGIVNSGPDGFFCGNVNLTAMPQPTGTLAGLLERRSLHRTLAHFFR